jgi:hypothetical protein
MPPGLMGAWSSERPERQSMAGEIEPIVTYPDGTIGPSLEALEAREWLDLE